MLKAMHNTNDKKKNNDLVNVIKSGLNDFKSKIKDMSNKEKEIEEPDKIVDFVERILEFNDWNQRGQGLKVLTPNQMPSRLCASKKQRRSIRKKYER